MDISINDFDFKMSGYSAYYVTFTSRKTGKKWQYRTTYMSLIDAIKNCKNPKKKDLKQLKWEVKHYGNVVKNSRN